MLAKRLTRLGVIVEHIRTAVGSPPSFFSLGSVWKLDTLDPD